MRQTREHDPRPFLTVIAWPDGFGRAELAALLSSYCELDPATLRLRLGPNGPSIVGQVSQVAADRAMQAVLRAGGDAFAPTLNELASLGPSLLIKDMSIRDDGHLDVELWNGLCTTIRREQVQILIRGQLKESMREQLPSASRTLPRPQTMIGGFRGAAVASALGAMGTAAMLGWGSVSDPGPMSTKQVRVQNKLDMHTTDGSVYQIIGSRFSFQVLGERRQPTDLANMDLLVDLLSHLAPDEIVDPYYPLWRPPPGHHRLRLPKSRAPSDPAFEFYSRWAALMYRHVLGERELI